MNAQQLKNSILQMAVQGKLVPQDPNDEPASVLLERIRKEKEKLIKEGKIKKEKNPSYIFRGEDNLPYEKVGKNEPVCIADAVPFEIPENWEWVRLGNIFNIRSAMRIHQTDWKTSGVPFFRGRELVQLIKSGKVDFEIYLSRELYEKNKEKGGVPKKDDILITAVGTIGQTYIVKGTQEFYYKDAYILCLENIGHVLLPEYIKLAIDSPYCQTDIHKDAMATTVSQLTIIKANSLFIPIPPLSEQVRIVQKYNEIVPIITEYDKKERQLTIINGSFPESLKKSILQQAVMGKLVPQDPNDEPASLLLEKIRAEKDALIKAGKLKKDKHESIIYRRDNSHYEKVNGVERCIDNEIPFVVPETWEWVRLGSLMSTISDGTHKTPNYVDRGVPFLSVQNISKGYFDLTRIKYITQEEHNKLIQRVKPEKNDILICRIGTLGKAIKCTVDFEFSIFVSLGLLRPVNHLTADYIITVINSPLGDNWIQDNKVGGGTHTYKINLADIPNMLIPLPPLSEQFRIINAINVAKVTISKL